MRDYGKLLIRVEDVIKTYNPITCTIDSHIADKIDNHKGSSNNNVDIKEREAENVFCKQVFYGCVRYKALLKVHNIVDYVLYFILENNTSLLYSYRYY